MCILLKSISLYKLFYKLYELNNIYSLSIINYDKLLFTYYTNYYYFQNLNIHNYYYLRIIN